MWRVTNNMEKKTNYIEKKDQARKLTLLLTYKGES